MKIIIKLITISLLILFPIRGFAEEMDTQEPYKILFIGNKIDEKDVPFRFYPKPMVSLKIKDHDVSNPDVISYLQGKVAGVRVTNGEISIRGGGTPLILLDGFPLKENINAKGITPTSLAARSFSNIIRSIPMSNIDRVEIYKNANETYVWHGRNARGYCNLHQAWA